MERIKKLLGRNPAPPASSSLAPKESAQSEQEQVGELDGLGRLIKAGHPRQHEIGKVMAGKIREQIGQREAGKERGQQYETDIKVFVTTEEGHKVGVVLKRDRYKVVFSLGEFSPTQVFEALHQTYPEMEVHTKPPGYFPAKWISGISEGEFTGLRLPLEGEDKEMLPRALWLMVRDQSSLSEDFSTLSSTGDIEGYYYGFNSLFVEAEPEIRHTLGETDPAYKAIDGSDQAYYTSIYHMPEGMPQLYTLQDKFGEFLTHLMPNDKAITLSVQPAGWDVPLGLREAQNYDDFRQVNEETDTTFNGASVNTSTEATNKYGSDKFTFTVDLNERGILEQRDAGYLIPFIYTRVRIEPEGIPFKDLSPEIERMRTM